MARVVMVLVDMVGFLPEAWKNVRYLTPQGFCQPFGCFLAGWKEMIFQPIYGGNAETTGFRQVDLSESCDLSPMSQAILMSSISCSHL